ncbi:hypothetical protein [Nonomuraea sp. NPDC049504]|uniref:hypothetical protein n=1 Tax=Nonomuraea sp. NPDC049504 TaxID=3154729 RepID=UPI00343DCAE8
MSMPSGAFARLARHVVAATAAALLIAAPSIAYADDAAPTHEPITMSDAAPSTVHDVPDHVSAPTLPEQAAIDTPVEQQQNAHMGGM